MDNSLVGEFSYQGLLPLGQPRWLEREGGEQLLALVEEGADVAFDVAGSGTI